ncbi:brivido-3 [Musca autumnalis]|uniref:brivido-3 n=1 Tax=Musca autumnalis TaxID=221902 RepID=UPI003CEEB882
MRNPKKSLKYSFFLSIGIIFISLICMVQFSGFRHESKKFKQMLVTTAIVIILRYILWEHIEAIATALFNTKVKQDSHLADHLSYGNEQFLNPHPLEYLKLRLESAKADLYLSNKHKNEELNVKYLQLTKDLWLFGKYFFLLLLMVVFSRNSYGYYNTKLMRTVFVENRLGPFGLRQMQRIEDLYEVVNATMSRSLCQGVDYGGKPLPEYGWMDFEIAKLVGVVRLQQIRVHDKSNGMKVLNIDHSNYLPQWKTPNRTYHYTDKFWRIYYPWLAKNYEGLGSWLLSIGHVGSLYSYEQHNPYETVLTRDARNNQKILKFLKENSWLDSRTAAVLIDFTLYNVDANMFSLISLMVEQTPFGGVVWHLDIQSAILLTSLDSITIWWWLLIIIYILQLMEFTKVLISKWWWLKSGVFFKSPWNCVDLVLVLLNIVIALLLITRESLVKHLLITLESSHKLDFIDFRIANLFDYMGTIAMGFLVSLTTLRLWKILQFASVFRLFTRTLYSAAGSLLTTLVGIHIFLFAIGFAAEIVNGSQAEVFSRYLKSLSSIMSFSFGFNSHTRPEDLSHGGSVLGFILYLILMFVVAIFLINLFITIICDHFAAARSERDNQPPNLLSYWDFLQMEFGGYVRFLKYFKTKKRKSSSLKEDFEKKLQKLEEKYEMAKESPGKVDGNYAADILRVQRLHNVVNILKLQLEILDRKLNASYFEWESDEEVEERRK